MKQTLINPNPVAIVTDFYSAFLAGDLDRAAAALAEDVVLHVPGTHALAGTHVGPAAVVGFVTGSRALTDSGETIELIDVLSSETRVAIYCRVTARWHGRTLDNTTVHLVRVDGDKIAEIWLHNFDDVAVNEFWSRS